jgi:hypothetical protein
LKTKKLLLCCIFALPIKTGNINIWSYLFVSKCHPYFPSWVGCTGAKL